MLIHKELKSTTQGETIPTQLEWSDTDPLAVKVNLHDGSKWIRWEFALDLLVVGLATVSPSWAGAGDVQIQTDSMDLCKLSLRGDDGTAEVSMDWDTVQWFVGRIVTEFSAEDEAKAVAAQVDMFLTELNAESF